MLEGRGVIPDVIAKPSRRDLLAERDTAFEAAMNFIQKPAFKTVGSNRILSSNR